MSLPEHDDVKSRYYLIHKPDTSPEMLIETDLCVQDVLDGTARENHSSCLIVVRSHDGTSPLSDQPLKRYPSRLPLRGFPCEDVAFPCDAMRRLVCWEGIHYELERYVEEQAQERFFLVGEWEDEFTVLPFCTVCLELRLEDVDKGLLRSACYVTACHTMYGQSFESLKTEHILGLASQLRPNIVKELKANGSGKLPPNIQTRKAKYPIASADDTLATVRITARGYTEECYTEVLDYLCAVLEQEESPHDYSVESRGSEKDYLPIPGLPKEGVNQFFACAAQYLRLHADIERHAWLVTRECEWYNNPSDESYAMPGTSVMFVLGLEGEQWVLLVTGYPDLCDDEHSSLQEKLPHAFVRRPGFQP